MTVEQDEAQEFKSFIYFERESFYNRKEKECYF
jgi:hypothetical protein